MIFNIIDNQEEWDSMSEEWNQLLQNSIQNVPFLTHEFLQAWWQYRGGGEWPNSSLYIVLARNSDEKIIGIAPLMSSKNSAGKQALMFIGNIEIADYLDVIVSEENHQVFLEELVQFLLAQNNWDILDLNNILEESPTISAFELIAATANLHYETNMLQPAPRIELPADFDEYLSKLDKKYRHEMKRKMRNAVSYFIPIEHYSVEDNNTLTQEMNDFEALMRNEERKNIFLSGSMPHQMQAIAKAAHLNGWLNLKFLSIGKEKAIGLFCFTYNNQIYLYNSGMSNKHGALSPGHVLMGHLIMESIDKGLSHFDFMRGDEEYKLHLGGENRFVHQVLISR